MASAKDLDHFLSIPWTRTLLAAPSTKTFPLASRIPLSRDGSQDVLVRRILNTSETMPHILGFYTSTLTPSSAPNSPNFLIPSCTLLFQLEEGLKGYNGITHGGFLGTLIDEAMGNLMVINRGLLSSLPSSQRNSIDVLDWEANAMLTAGINIRYLKPLVLPATVAAVASLNRIEGRKVVFDVVIRGEGEGEMFVKAEGIWLSVPKEKVGRMKL